MTVTDDKGLWNAFCECLCESVAAIEKCYFEFPRYGEEKDTIRERVYCYELYHQLRCRLDGVLPDDWLLHGELDKSGHKYVIDTLGCAAIPDFVIHKPGEPAGFAVIEVKRAGRRGEPAPTEVKKDFDKLVGFTGEELGYQHAILLVFGRYANERSYCPPEGVRVLLHEEPGKRPIGCPPNEESDRAK